MSQSEVTKMAIALPRDTHCMGACRGEREERSLNAVVVRLIRDHLQQQKPAVQR